MPYVSCARCGLRTFSVSYWSNVDYCAGCGAEFPRPPRKAVSIARYHRFGALPMRSRLVPRPRAPGRARSQANDES